MVNSADQPARPPRAERDGPRPDRRVLHRRPRHGGVHLRRRRTALHFGSCKINLHGAGNEFEPKAHRPTPGSADLCFLVPSDDIAAELVRAGVPVEEGPVTRTGAAGTLTSLYVRDPAHNLIEVSNCA